MKLTYKGDKDITLLVPVNRTFSKGDYIEVTNKQTISELKKLGFSTNKSKEVVE